MPSNAPPGSTASGHPKGSPKDLLYKMRLLVKIRQRQMFIENMYRTRPLDELRQRLLGMGIAGEEWLAKVRQAQTNEELYELDRAMPWMEEDSTAGLPECSPEKAYPEQEEVVEIGPADKPPTIGTYDPVDQYPSVKPGA